MSKKFLVYKRSYAAVVKGFSEEEEEDEEVIEAKRRSLDPHEEEDEEVIEAKRRSLDPHEQVATEGRSEIPPSWMTSFSYKRYG